MIMAARVHAVNPWKHQSSTMEACKLVTSRSMEHAGKQKNIEQSYGSTGSGLVAAIQQLYKLSYKSCSEAKQNNE